MTDSLNEVSHSVFRFFFSVLCPLVYRSATTSKSPAWYCAGSSCTAKQLFMSRHGYKTSWGVLWCLAPIVEPLGPVMSGVGASMDWTRSSPSNRCLIGLGYGEFGGLVDTLTSLSCPSSHSWAVFVLWRGTLSCWGGDCHCGVLSPQGGVLGPQLRLDGCCCVSSGIHIGVWTIGFSAEHYIVKMINVSHTTCQWF